jgi:hypothetical protein
VRNDRPGVGETREQMYARRHQTYMMDRLPSRNKPKRRMEIPPGCISIFRIHHYDGRKNVYHGVYRNEDEAYRIADSMWLQQPRWGDRNYFEVEHKAAIELEGRFYIVNLAPIRFTEPPSCTAVLLGGTGLQEGASS